MIYVLMIVASVQGGTNYTLHDFRDKAACEAAADFARERQVRGITTTKCVPAASTQEGASHE